MQRAAFQFRLDGEPIFCEPFGNGHINETYILKTDRSHAYILQKVNHHVFRDVPALMRNIALVTRYLASYDPDPRHVLTLIPTKDGGDFYLNESGEYWRVYDFITDSVCLDTASSAENLYQSGVAFGRFQSMLSHFPADTLSETIPHFHDTPWRYEALHEAIRKDSAGRAQEVQSEIAFALSREDEAGLMVRMLRDGQLPLRVTHNDTKLNNVMLDAVTFTPLCVIDLDTVMPGLAANDFGDTIRSGASTAAEDEKDLSKVSLSLELFQAYARGFLGACGAGLTQNELDTLSMGAKLMTLECGVRFLTDYLSGDTYFRIHRKEHNLDRCRTQFKLVLDMEIKWDKLQEIIRKESGR